MENPANIHKFHPLLEIRTGRPLKTLRCGIIFIRNQITFSTFFWFTFFIHCSHLGFRATWSRYPAEGKDQVSCKSNRYQAESPSRSCKFVIFFFKFLVSTVSTKICVGIMIVLLCSRKRLMKTFLRSWWLWSFGLWLWPRVLKSNHRGCRTPAARTTSNVSARSAHSVAWTTTCCYEMVLSSLLCDHFGNCSIFICTLSNSIWISVS